MLKDRLLGDGVVFKAARITLSEITTMGNQDLVEKSIKTGSLRISHTPISNTVTFKFDRGFETEVANRFDKKWDFVTFCQHAIKEAKEISQREDVQLAAGIVGYESRPFPYPANADEAVQINNRLNN